MPLQQLSSQLSRTIIRVLSPATMAGIGATAKATAPAPPAVSASLSIAEYAAQFKVLEPLVAALMSTLDGTGGTLTSFTHANNTNLKKDLNPVLTAVMTRIRGPL